MGIMDIIDDVIEGKKKLKVVNALDNIISRYGLDSSLDFDGKALNRKYNVKVKWDNYHVRSSEEVKDIIKEDMKKRGYKHGTCVKVIKALKSPNYHFGGSISTTPLGTGGKIIEGGPSSYILRTDNGKEWTFMANEIEPVIEVDERMFSGISHQRLFAKASAHLMRYIGFDDEEIRMYFSGRLSSYGDKHGLLDRILVKHGKTAIFMDPEVERKAISIKILDSIISDEKLEDCRERFDRYGIQMKYDVHVDWDNVDTDDKGDVEKAIKKEVLKRGYKVGDRVTIVRTNDGGRVFRFGGNVDDLPLGTGGTVSKVGAHGCVVDTDKGYNLSMDNREIEPEVKLPKEAYDNGPDRAARALFVETSSYLMKQIGFSEDEIVSYETSRFSGTSEGEVLRMLEGGDLA
ncbi:MAG: hypothetical protein ABIB71_06245 [Candidatus Woesearchaeota archaeon]